MPRVDFYVLAEHTDEEAERFLCRLCEKIQRLGQRVAILADAATQERLDTLLWTFRPESYVPHACVATPDMQPSLSVRLLPGLSGASACEVVVNLLPALPPCAQDETRIIELVRGDPVSRKEARQRFQAYRALGLEPVTTQIDARF